MHILFCVLGYQFFMCQGTLVFSKSNWSMYLNHQQKRSLHWIFQVLGSVLAFAGTILMIREKHVNFNTSHGITGLCAMISALVGIVNGMLAMYAYKLNSYFSIRCIKYIHYITGIGTIFISAICLCLGFNKKSFKIWSDEADALVLIITTCIFTVLVTLDFLIHFGKRIFGSQI